MGKKHIQQKLVDARKNRGFTQKYIANYLGVQKSTVCNWEKSVSKPRGEHAKKLSILLDLPLEDII